MISTFLFLSGQKGQHLTATVLTVGTGDSGLQSRLTDGHIDSMWKTSSHFESYQYGHIARAMWVKLM